MYQIGQQVVYGAHGVCRVTDLEDRVIDRKKVTYLVLEPVGQGGARYLVPTHNAAAMGKLRKMLSAEELEALMESDTVRTAAWIKDENVRKNLYRELIGSGNREKLMQMVYTLYHHTAQQTAAGKKVHLCDVNFLRDAEKLIIGEISIVLNLDPETAKKYIRKKLKEDA